MQAAKQGVKRIRVHTLTDGRDCEDGSSVKLMKSLTKDCEEVSKGGCDVRVASGGGRMRVTMDRYEVCSLIPAAHWPVAQHTCQPCCKLAHCKARLVADAACASPCIAVRHASLLSG